MKIDADENNKRGSRLRIADIWNTRHLYSIRWLFKQ